MEKYVITIGQIHFKPAMELLNKYEFVELRIDLVDWNLKEILAFIHKAKRIIVTYRPEVSDLQRLDVLRQIRWSSVDFVDLELDNELEYVDAVLSFIRPADNVKIIWSVHDYTGQLDVEQAFIQYEEKKLPGSIFKIATTCNTFEQADDLLSLYGDKRDLIVIGMGSKGRRTRVEGLRHGAPFMYLAAAEIGALASGQFTKEEILRNDEYFVAGVIGRPISHSKSPLLFNSFFKANEINAKYLRFAVWDISEVQRMSEYLPLSFVNITAPFKRQTTEDNAPVNVWRMVDGCYYNTDIVALENLIEEKKFSANSKCLIIGSGGSAEAVINAFRDYSTTLVARNTQRVETLCGMFDLDFIEWSILKDEICHYDILAWTIPATVWGEKNLSIASHQFLIDVNYNNSLIGEYIAVDKSKYFSGKDWLISQALPVMAWFGKTPTLDEMNKWFDDDKSYEDKPIVLVGLPASGKSTVAQSLSDQFEVSYKDTDDEVQNNEEQSVEEIFDIKGEEYFRNAESRALIKLIGEERVVSTGGGIVELQSNRELLNSSAFVVWLCVNPEIAVERLGNSIRPMFNNENKLEIMTGLNLNRTPLYAEVADLVICTDGHSSEEIANWIYEEYSFSK